MAVSANRSRSPSPVTGRSNPRNAEINNGVRRGFTGNPLFKPSIVATSPSDFGKGGVLVHQNEKENETAKAVQIRSPAVSKGTKNFMSPTIAATTKITASPRKKVLIEKNEMIRTSMSSSSDGRSIISSLNLQEMVEDLNSNPYSSDSTVTDLDQREASSWPSKAYKTKPVLNSQVPKSFSSETLPPYDPHINYLAPRPQFLRYKPNPRIERIRRGECKQLEDCFSSDSTLSDTETTDDIQSENSSSSVELMETAQVEAEVSGARTTEAKVVSKSYSFLRLKPISLLVLLLFVGYYWITITGCPFINSVIDSSIGKQLRFTKLYEPAELSTVARTNYDGLTRNFRLWSTNTVSYFAKMIPTVKESNEVRFVWFPNFTDSVKEQNLQWPMKEMEIGILQIDQGNLVSEADEEGEEASQVNPEFKDAKLIQEAEVTEPGDSKLEQGTPELEESNLSVQDEVVEPHTSEVHQTGDESRLISNSIQVSQASEFEPEAEIAAPYNDHEPEAQVPHVSEMESELPQAEKLHGENRLISIAVVGSSVTVSEPESSESEALTENSQSFKELYLSLKEKSSAVNILGIFLLTLILTVAGAFMFAKQPTSPTHSSSTATPMDQLQANKLASTPTAVVENTYEERMSSRNWPTEVDMVGESCPSEMSSFQRTTSYSRKESKGASEAQSQERGLRKSNKRESLASSSEYSMGSPSYGGYTTHEKVHSKQGGDQEEVTPVRRSSRIQSQVPEFENDQSCPPYDPIDNYLAPRPQFRFYKPNSRLRRMRVEGCFCEFCSDIKSNEETRPQISSFVEEGQNEDLEESEATLEETAQVDPNVPESKNDQSCPPYDYINNYLAPRPQFRLYKPNSRLRRMVVEGCFCELCSDIKSNEETRSQISSSTEEGQNEDVEESEATLEVTAQVDQNVPESENDQSCPPYDPIKNYLAPRPQFRLYKPNSRLRKCMEVEECFYDSWSDIESNEESQSQISSSVEEWQNEDVEEIEATLEETAQVDPNVSEQRTTEAKVVSKSYSFFRLKPISLLLLLLVVGCCWIKITDSPLICSVIDSSIGKDLRFTKVYESAELAEVARTYYEGLTRNFKLWSTNRVSNFSKKIPFLKEPNELSVLWFSNFNDSKVDIVGSVCLLMENQKNLQWPMKEVEIGTVQMTENVVIEAHEKGDEASEVTPEFEKAKLIQEPYQSESEEIQEEYHFASHIDIDQASQEPEKATLIQEPDQSESEVIQEEYHLASHIDNEQPSLEPELEEQNLSLKDELVNHHNLEGQQTKEESNLIPCEAQSILAEEGQVPEISEVEPEDVELQGKQRLISDPEVVASPIDQEAQVPQVSEIMSELPRAEKLPNENKLIAKAEFESNGVVSEPEILESEDLTAYSQSLKELYLSLKEKPSAIEVFLGISLLILVLTAAAAFMSGKQHKFPSPSVVAIPIDQFLAKKVASTAMESVENTHQEKLSWTTEIDMLGQSCPPKGATSEYLMISPSNCKTELKGANEAQSQQRGMRKSNKRESLASSSEYSKGSTTYGSYTLYERISHKHGCGEEMVITAVRRSCRIRNMVSVC